MSSYKFTQRAVASPDAPLKPLVRKRARSGGETWVQVTRRPDSRAKKPRTGGSQQPACAHTEHDILSTTDGLWAMPLNTGWVPVKPRRLQDWEKLKKYVPSHKHGDVCPNGVPALADNESDSE